MLRKYVFPLLIFSFTFSAHSQQYNQQWPLQISKDAQIMLLTVSPGHELYSSFGHSALRVVDPEQNLDMVFNYGAFYFEPTIDFYWRFVQGRLNYMLSVYPYETFLREYTYYNRSVVQQSLELNDTQKNKVYHFLLENNLPENREYKYDFFYDNCSSRIRDVFERELKGDIHFYPGDRQFNKTYRELVHEYTSVKPWADLGIKLILGYPADKKATGRGYMFLPDYMMFAFDSAVITVDGKRLPFVKGKEIILEKKADDQHSKNRWYMQPTVLMWVILLPLLIASVKELFSKRRKMWIDFLIYLTAGFCGLFLLFCWFGTDHVVLPLNFNMLWAFPGHSIMGLLIHKAETKRWIRLYFLTFSAIAVLILLNWLWLPQPFHVALVPFILLISLRGVVIYRHKNCA